MVFRGFVQACTVPTNVRMVEIKRPHPVSLHRCLLLPTVYKALLCVYGTVDTLCAKTVHGWPPL